MLLKIDTLTEVNETAFRDANPGVLFPALLTDIVLAGFGYAILDTAEPSVPNGMHMQANGFEQVNGIWKKKWVLVNETPEQALARAQQVQVIIVNAVQRSLDTFAKTRNYDSIMSACTYATSKVAKFAAEGQRCVDLRDETWAALYGILEQVQLGVRPLPNGFGDVEGDLPVLAWL